MATKYEKITNIRNENYDNSSLFRTFARLAEAFGVAQVQFRIS